MQYTQTPRVPILFNCPATMRDGLRAVAAREGEPVSVVIRRLINDGLRGKTSARNSTAPNGALGQRPGVDDDR